MAGIFLQRRPAPPLDRFIEYLWYCYSDPQPMALEKVLPSGKAQLIVNLKEDQTRTYRREGSGQPDVASGTVLAGIQSRYSVIDTAEQEHVVGVTFKPGGARAFFDVPAYETQDLDVSLEFLWGRRHAANLREQLLTAGNPQVKLSVLEQALKRACRMVTPNPCVALAVHRLSREEGLSASIASLADQANLSARYFIDRFKDAVGVTPKRFARIIRFQSALTRAHRGDGIDWTRLAVDTGYYDQAHFIHDFKSFAGLTPSQYILCQTKWQNHVKFLQSGAENK